MCRFFCNTNKMRYIVVQLFPSRGEMNIFNTNTEFFKNKITVRVNPVHNKYNNWCKASKLIAPALTTIWSQIFKMGSWKKTAMQNCLLCY